MTYKDAVERAADVQGMLDQIVKKLAATYRWSEKKIRKDIKEAIRARSLAEEKTDE